jgi:hypothetical protein
MSWSLNYMYTYRVVTCNKDFTDISLLKGEALLTVGYTIFGNKSYSYKMYS